MCANYSDNRSSELPSVFLKPNNPTIIASSSPCNGNIRGTSLVPDSQTALSTSNIEWTAEFAKVVSDVITIDNTASVARLTANSTNQNFFHFNDPRNSLQSSNQLGMSL